MKQNISCRLTCDWIIAKNFVKLCCGEISMLITREGAWREMGTMSTGIYG